MKFSYFIFVILTLLASCSIERKTSQDYLRWVGDIEHDASVDRADFELCHGDKHVRQYFNMQQGLQIEGEKEKIEQYFLAHYKPVDLDQSGWIRIRFIVNCQGETGRFRMLESDDEYQERPFDRRISEQIMALTKSLEGWKVLKMDGDPVDYYQYLIFKIRGGEIEKIMP